MNRFQTTAALGLIAALAMTLVNYAQQSRTVAITPTNITTVTALSISNLLAHLLTAHQLTY